VSLVSYQNSGAFPRSDRPAFEELRQSLLRGKKVCGEDVWTECKELNGALIAERARLLRVMVAIGHGRFAWTWHSVESSLRPHPPPKASINCILLVICCMRSKGPPANLSVRSLNQISRGRCASCSSGIRLRRLVCWQISRSKLSLLQRSHRRKLQVLGRLRS
jgi:hypothetical protein